MIRVFLVFSKVLYIGLPYYPQRGCGGRNLVKISLHIKVRSKSRSCITSVPLKRLVELSVFPKRSWSFKDGWLVLEGTI